MSDIYYRLSKNAFVRIFENYGYIVNQLNRHDRIYDRMGCVFLSTLSRKMQTFDEMLENVASQFDESYYQEIRADFMSFLVELELSSYVISGYSEIEISQKDPAFSYANNPKIVYNNHLQYSDDMENFSDSTEILRKMHNEKAQIHSCQIEVTNRCNERCIHCYIPHKEKNKNLPLSNIESLLKQLYNEMHTLGLTITGGDPFKHPDIDKILKLARQYDFSFCVLSNLTLIKPYQIALLKELNVSFIQASLYSTIPEEHDHITQLKGSCEKTKNMIDQLVKADIPVQIACPAMKTNFRSYKDVMTFGKERGCKVNTDFILMGRSDYSTDNLNERLSLEETELLLRDILKYNTDYVDSITPQEAFNLDREKWANEPVCGIGRDSISVSANGDVYPCSGWTKMSCGNIKEMAIKDIWEKSPEILRLRKLKKGNFKKCLDCNYGTFCSICPSRNASESGGNLMESPKHHCEVTALNYKIAQEVISAKRGKNA